MMFLQGAQRLQHGFFARDFSFLVGLKGDSGCLLQLESGNLLQGQRSNRDTQARPRTSLKSRSNLRISFQIGLRLSSEELAGGCWGVQLLIVCCARYLSHIVSGLLFFYIYGCHCVSNVGCLPGLCSGDGGEGGAAAREGRLWLAPPARRSAAFGRPLHSSIEILEPQLCTVQHRSASDSHLML